MSERSRDAAMPVDGGEPRVIGLTDRAWSDLG